MRLMLYIVLFTAFFSAGDASAACIRENGDSAARARAVDYLYIKALDFMEQDSLDRAFELLEHCHSLAPLSTTVMFDLAPFYTYLKNDTVAQQLLNRIVEAEPSNIHYSIALVNFYNYIGNKKAAIDVYEKIIDTVPSKSDVYVALLDLYISEEEHEKAIDILEKLEKLEGATDEILFLKLQRFVYMKDSTHVAELLGDMIERNPDDMRYLGMKGDVYMMLGDHKVAYDAYDKVLAVEPDNDSALLSLANLYRIDGEDSLYCRTMERLLKSEWIPTETRISKLLDYIQYKGINDTLYVGPLLEELVQLPYDRVPLSEVYVNYLLFHKVPAETVTPVLENILLLEPENSSAMLQLLVFAIEKNDYEAVVRHADNAMLYIPEMLELYYYKGLSCYLLGKPEESIAVYKKGLELRSEDASMDLVSNVYNLLGDTYHELNMNKECMQAYDSALVYNPSNIAVLNNYAYYLAIEGKELERALEMSHKTITEEPDNNTYIDTYAWILFCLERYEEAKVYADRLMATESKELGAVEYHHCGDIYALCGDTGRAVECWTKAQSLGDESKSLKKKIKKRKYYSDAKKRK